MFVQTNLQLPCIVMVSLHSPVTEANVRVLSAVLKRLKKRKTCFFALRIEGLHIYSCTIQVRIFFSLLVFGFVVQLFVSIDLFFELLKLRGLLFSLTQLQPLSLEADETPHMLLNLFGKVNLTSDGVVVWIRTAGVLPSFGLTTGLGGGQRGRSFFFCFLLHTNNY